LKKSKKSQDELQKIKIHKFLKLHAQRDAWPKSAWESAEGLKKRVSERTGSS
jgi:hypothetical protein